MASHGLKRHNLRVLFKQRKARLRAALREKKRLEQQCQDAPLEELESACRAVEQEKSAAVEKERQRQQ